MSARVVEAARAFATIAEHLPEEKRTALAEKIAELIDSSITPARAAAPTPPREVLPDPTHAVYDQTAKFLADHGFSSADLVRAAGQLEEFLKQHSNLTREAGMHVWLCRQRGVER